MTIMQIPISIILKRILFVICCILCAIGGGLAVCTRYMALPDGVTTQSEIEAHWFVHFWYVWAAFGLSYIIIMILCSQKIWRRIRQVTVKAGENVGVSIGKNGKLIKHKYKEE